MDDIKALVVQLLVNAQFYCLVVACRMNIFIFFRKLKVVKTASTYHTKCPHIPPIMKYPKNSPYLKHVAHPACYNDQRPVIIAVIWTGLRAQACVIICNFPYKLKLLLLWGCYSLYALVISNVCLKPG